VRFGSCTAHCDAGGLAFSYIKPSALPVDWSALPEKISVMSPPLIVVFWKMNFI